MDSLCSRIMECAVCLGAYDSQDYRPLFLPCGHSICASCVSELSAGRESFMCPSCRKEISSSEAENLPTNFSLLTTSQTSIKSQPEEAKLDSPASPTCSFHPSKKVKFHCVGCQQSFCSKCVVKHTGTGHKIEELMQVVDHQLDQLLLTVADYEAELAAVNAEFEGFERKAKEMETLKTRVEDLYSAYESHLRSEKETALLSLTQGIASNAQALSRAREELRLKSVAFTEAKEVLRSARHALTNTGEKQASFQRAEALLSDGKVRRPECEVKTYALMNAEVPERFIALKPGVTSFLLPEVEEKKEVVERKQKEEKKEPEWKKVAQKPEEPTPLLQKAPASLAREQPKGKKRTDVCWWYMNDSSTWAPYPPGQSRQLEHAYQNRDTTLDLGRYLVDFSTLTQVNKKTGKLRKIGREIS